jgi:hypothetical protein
LILETARSSPANLFLFQRFIWLSGKDTSCFTEAEVFLQPPQIDFLTPGVISHCAKAMVRPKSKRNGALNRQHAEE